MGGGGEGGLFQHSVLEQVQMVSESFVNNVMTCG